VPVTHSMSGPYGWKLHAIGLHPHHPSDAWKGAGRHDGDDRLRQALPTVARSAWAQPAWASRHTARHSKARSYERWAETKRRSESYGQKASARAKAKPFMVPRISMSLKMTSRWISCFCVVKQDIVFEDQDGLNLRRLTRCDRLRMFCDQTRFARI
jgi:hypothetical protein